MANAEHLNVFEQGVGTWNRWRQKHRGLRPDLSGADLKRANFRYANLNDANLEHANLEGANLGRAYLEGAELQGAAQRGAHLFSADLRQADLRKADLREAQLWYAHLERADLRGANLSRADLRSSDLTAADLRGADLAGASLSCANLRRTDLRDANLEQTNLHGARFSECRLEGANLDRAEAALTAFNAVDLSQTRGLGSMHHERPSSIGIDTLEDTGSGLDGAPRREEIVRFLRAAGVPDSYIEILRAKAGDRLVAPRVYLVHSLADREFARRLYDQLQLRGVRCWLHEQPMLPGENLDEGFDLGPRAYEKVVLCCSEASLTSWWLAKELAAAEPNRKPTADLGHQLKVLVPVVAGGEGGRQAWEKLQASRNLPPLAADFTGWENDEKLSEPALARLVALLSRDAPV